MREFKLLSLDDCAIKLATNASAGTVEGYASVFNGTDVYNDTVAPGAFKATIIKLKAKGRPLPMVENHTGPVIGKWTNFEEDSRGLKVHGELTPGHSGAENVYASLKHGAVSGLSIGYRAKDSNRLKDGRRLLKEIELHEISIVGVPADEGARTTFVKSVGQIKSAADLALVIEQNAHIFASAIATRGWKEAIRDYEGLLRDGAGFSHAAAKAIAAGGYKSSEPWDEDGAMSNLLRTFKDVRAGL